MKRREKEHKNLKMKGGVLSVWFKIKNIKSFNRPWLLSKNPGEHP